MKLSIILPSYNEEENVPLILDKFSNIIKRGDIEVIIVNNGSTDNTENILKELLPKYSFLKVVKVDVNQGYGFGILSGLKAAQGEYIGWTHADLQTDLADVIKALEIIEAKGSPKNIYVKGKRKKRPFFDTFFTVGMSFFESLLLKTFLWDINGQPNIFHRTLFESWENPPYDFSLDLYAFFTAKKQNYEILRFDVILPERIHGSSHWNTGLGSKLKLIERTMDFSFNLKKEFNKK